MITDVFISMVPSILTMCHKRHGNSILGGYQPAQKYLKDRKGRTLTPEDVMHYENIITVLIETDRIMQGIN